MVFLLPTGLSFSNSIARSFSSSWHLIVGLSEGQSWMLSLFKLLLYVHVSQIYIASPDFCFEFTPMSVTYLTSPLKCLIYISSWTYLKIMIDSSQDTILSTPIPSYLSRKHHVSISCSRWLGFFLSCSSHCLLRENDPNFPSGFFSHSTTWPLNHSPSSLS